MADDIDIEEHDVLDNPRIKNIFPDITSIKTEVIDYEEEGIVESDTENYETFHTEQENPTLEDVEPEIPSLFQNRIILGTKPSESSEPTSESELDEIPEIIESSVVLEDWGVLLENNPCYCHSCQILFPTENALDSHKMTAHSFLVAVGRNKAIKSTSKSSISARLKFETSGEVLCNHCNQIFPDEIALLKHSYELIPRKYPCNFCGLVFDNEVVSKIHEMTHSNTSNVIIVMRCPICTCHFKFTNKLTSHMSLQHKVELNNLPERVRTNYKCAYCPAIMRDNKTYNGHIGLRHPEFYNKIVDDENDKFKCLPCNLTFPSAYSEKIHRAAQHVSKTPDFFPKRSLELNKPIKIEPLSPKSSPQKTDYSRRLIPKNTLFKCKKCNIHYISALVAIEHSKRCPIKKGDWKCDKCKRSFKSVDREFHNKQHEWTDRFKIITVKENLMNELLYKCKSCNVCFDERTFLKYHVQGCIETASVLCVVCNNSVHEHAITKHKRLHNELDQFTVVDFLSIDHVNPNPIPASINVKNPKEKFYYFCPTCRCYMKVNKLSDHHNIGKCRKQMKIICQVCGLTFSRKGYVTHKKTHKNFPRLKLRDLTFRSTQSSKTIKPPFPDFKKCTNCFVKFYSSQALKSHVCNMEEAKTCEYCGEKFSDLAYKLHVPFHEYSGTEKKTKKIIKLSENIPELIKKYESLQIIWNILFLCETCDTILDSYDQVVEHSQDHFCKMESYNVNINHCSTCDLKIVGQCFEKHKKLHAENAVSKSSFKILTYKYDTLLSDSWYDMFDTLAKEQVDQILNGSKYKHTRGVRMRLVTDGPIDITLYQCDICKMIIDWIDVAEHARNSNNCNQTSKVTCSECQLLFTSRRAHQDFHERQESTKKAARIIRFNSTQDFYVNDALRSKMNPEGLKFIRCQHCGKLINKAKYQKHILHHKNYENSKSDSKTQPKLIVRPKFKKMEITHNFYKCVKCNVCVFRNKVHTHFCSLKSQKKQCPKCHLWFRSSHMYKHQMYHEKFRLTKNNVNVYTFKDGKVDTERKTGKVTLYQCSNCSICLHKQESLRRHICMSSNYQKLCTQCEMPFHRTRMQLHRRLHDTRDFSKKDIVVKKFKSNTLLIDGELELPSKVKKEYKKKKKLLTKPAKKMKYSKSSELTDKEFLRHVHNRLFKCTCNLLFITAAALIDHVGVCASDYKGVKCCECNLVFHESEINIHKESNKCSQILLLYIVTLDSANGMKYDHNWCLFRCWQCDINYVTFRAVFNHVEKSHVIRQKMIQCESCDITLSTRSFPQHKSMHQQFSNFIRGDINMFTVTQMKYSEVLSETTNTRIDSVTKYEEEPVKVTELSKKVVKRKLELKEDVKKHRKIDDSLEKESKIQKYDLHHCEICELNFLHRKTFKLHLTGNHKEIQFTCPICRLKFTRYTLTRHLKVHHGKTNYSAKSQDLGTGDEASDHEDTNSDAQEEVILDESEITDHRSDNNSLQEVIQTDKPQHTNIQTDNTNKLYKCSECDVYFLSPDACRDHVTDHMTLDPTEYIACKICDLQFLCEYLGSHMKCHRQKTFNIDEIIIEEYSFSGGQIKIDSYPAAERLKSKVTTTTYIDESTVDSTVSEVKRDFNDSVVSSGNNENSDVEMKSAVSDTNTELDVRSNFLISSNDNTLTE